MEREFSNSAQVNDLLRKTGFQVLIAFSIVISVVIILAAPDNSAVAWAFPIFWFGISALALLKPFYSSTCAKIWIVFSLPMTVLLVLSNGLLPATIIAMATIFPVMLTTGVWRIVSVSIIAGATLLVPLSTVEYDSAVWLRLSVTNIFVAIMVFLLTTFLEKALVDSLDKSDALNLALEGQYKANEVQSVFLATMSHEIRTPMNGIIGLVDIVLSAEITEDQRPKLQRVKRAGTSLNRILNDILDHSKLTAGKLVIENAPICMSQLIRETQLLFEKPALDKEITLTCHIDKSLHNTLMSDPTRITQILNNLVSNAIKFTHNNGVVKLTLKIINSTHANQEIEVCIADTGIGISPANISCLFGSFVQVNKSSTREHCGTGLGLQISKRLVNAMGGDMWVESQENVGSQFYFRLTLSKTNLKPLVMTDQVISGAKEFTGKVLVVEDNEINQVVATEMIKSYGLTVEIANDGLEAIECVKQSHFVLIFMDLQMPKMDGFTATEMIRQSNTQTPIVALSASVLQEDVDRAKCVGMNDHIGKPINRTELLGVLQRYFAPN